jgi:uncharacterized protein (TIGR00299 family) protein
VKDWLSGNMALIDAQVAGVSGDMFLGALIDLGASENRLRKVAKLVKENLPGTRTVDVQISQVERGEICAKLVTVASEESVSERKGKMIRDAIGTCAQGLGLTDWGKKFAMSVIDTLLQAESHVHHHPVSEVELHELGSADTLVDILGVASLTEELGLHRVEWWSTSIGIGTGPAHFSGRDYPNPPPAAAEILRSHRFPIVSGTARRELTTPTGAAIAVNLAENASEKYPGLKPEKIGYGAGSSELIEVANLLRIIVGERIGGTHSHDNMVILETNLDDVTGEVIGHATERLLASGARDVTVTPVYMKKNRPGHIIQVIADASNAENLANLMIKETGTLGVREIPVTRHIVLRTKKTQIVRLGTKHYPVSVKVGMDENGKVIKQKIEYDDRSRMAKRAGLSLREFEQQVSVRGDNKQS